MDDAKRHVKRWTPVATGLATSLSSAALLLAAHFKTEDGTSTAWFVPLFSLTVGALAALFHARRLQALLGGLIFGLSSGALSSFGLIGQPVEDVFFAIAATLVFFVVLGLIFGAFVEFVMFLHHLAHGRDRRTYGGPKKG